MLRIDMGSRKPAVQDEPVPYSFHGMCIACGLVVTDICTPSVTFARALLTEPFHILFSDR